MAISEETKYGLAKFLDILTAGLSMLPYPGCSTAAGVIQKFVTPDMIAQAAAAVGIREIVILHGEDGCSFTGIVDQRKKS